MTYTQFIAKLNSEDPPKEIVLRALWLDKKGKWDEAHNLVDDLGGRQADRVHAYLHRKEGVEWNARYWYRQINVQYPNMTLDQEWDMLAKQFTSSK